MTIDLIETPPVFAYELTAADRCDACSARAYVAVGYSTVPAGGEQKVTELLFCAHHYTANEPVLAVSPSLRYVKDERAVLVQEELMRRNHA